MHFTVSAELGHHHASGNLLSRFAMDNQQPDHSASDASRYRAYLIGNDGRIAKVVEILAEDDPSAIASVRELAESHEIDLWDRSRVVMRLSQTFTR